MMNLSIKLAGLLLLVWAPAAAQAEWREASSRHFLVYSEGSAQSLQDFATKLEKFDKAMRLRLGIEDSDPGPANRVSVYVVDNVAAVRRLGGFAARSDVAGFYTGRAIGSIAVVPRSSGSGAPTSLDPTTVLLHEYSHHIMLHNAAVAYPAWFREGFAEFNSTARFEKDGSLGFGAAANHRAWGLVGMNPLPIELLFDPTKRKLTPLEWEATIYGRGWLLTHYLMFAEKRVGQLGRYIAALNAGKGSLEAAQAAFGDLKALDKELKAYLNQRRIPYYRIAAERLATAPAAMRILRPGEAAIMELRMRSRLGVPKEERQRLARDMARVASSWPNDPAVQAALAEAELDAGNLDAAEAAANRAVAADPRHGDGLTYKARVAMARAQSATSDRAAAWKEARRLIVQANSVDADDPEPLILFYQSYAAQGVPPTRNAVDGLLRAFELAPQDTGLRMNVARQLLIDGKTAEARRALAPIAFDPHGGPLGQAVTAIIARLDEGGAKAALDAWEAAARAAQKPAS